MVVTTIYLTRHGFRTNWIVDPKTGQYQTNIPSPTGITGDVPLAAYGERQSEELATALSAIDDPPISRIYSSPFYRCLQTLQPFAEKSGIEVRGDNGLGEWYGVADFPHPIPANASELRTLFPWYATNYAPSGIPPLTGETLPELHDRCAYALQYIIASADAEDNENDKALGKTPNGNDFPGRRSAILICAHAASLIALARALTGKMPDDMSKEDFKTYTCGISKFERRHTALGNCEIYLPVEAGMPVPRIEWRDGKGVAGGWNCVTNGDCSHLEGGEERGWGFKDAGIF
ncbi:C6 zinc cluster transcription factor-like protein [Lecanora helva]